MQRDYYIWQAVLRDGSMLSEYDGAAHNSLYRPARDVAELKLIPAEGAGLSVRSVVVPEGARVIYFKQHRGVAGFDPNRNFAGLWYIITAHPLKKWIAEQRQKFEREFPGASDAEVLDFVAKVVAEQDGGSVGDKILRQASHGYTVTLDELLSFDLYCIGYELSGVRRVEWIAPTGETLATDGTEFEIGEHGAITMQRAPTLQEKIWREAVAYHSEKILEKINRAKEEIESFETMLANL